MHTDSYRLLKARLCELLDLLRIGVVFERAQGDRLWYRQDGQEIEILDLVGGFGSLLLGHNHPALVAEAQRLLAAGVPVHAQGSRRETAGRLAVELSRRCGGDFRVVLANSGAEAVEAAMKHAILETGSRTFVALERAFHGKTLGALQLTANPDVREPFEILGLQVLRVRPNDLEHLEKTFADAPPLAGFIYEPIQGEGGVHEITPEFAKRARELCTERKIPLIADEIQCGLGRTGSFLASPVPADYILLSKTLGGGIAKIAALLIRRERYVAEFDRMHSSTYAEDDFSSAIALKTLELLDGRNAGSELKDALQRLVEKYPEVLKEVRGRGLMLGLEFKPQPASRSFMFRFLGDDLVRVAAGYLFNVHRLRVLPTLSDPFTLRFEPSIDFTETDRVITALDDVCARIRSGDAMGLTGYFLRSNVTTRFDPPEPDDDFLIYDEPTFLEAERDVPPVRVGWLFHLVDANDLISLERSFGEISLEKREQYLRHVSGAARPVVMNSVDVRSATGQVVRLHAILLPYTSKQIKRWIDEDRLSRPQAAVENGIEVAKRLGCKLVSLGQYTSIVTHNGLRVRRSGIGVTTGNSYAVALALQTLPEKMCTVAVVGAAGNIGRACAELVAPRCERLILVGSDKPGSRLRLSEVAKGLDAEIGDLASLRHAEVVIAAVNATDAPIGPQHVAPEATVIDLSVPYATRNVRAIRGGLVRLPGNEDLRIVGFHLPVGQTYACMAEGLLLGFEGIFDTEFTGSITASHVRRVIEMADRHGFELAEKKTRCVLGTGHD